MVLTIMRFMSDGRRPEARLVKFHLQRHSPRTTNKPIIQSY